MLYCKGLSRFHKFLGIKFRIKLRPKHYKKVGIIFGSKDGIGNRIFGLINVLNYFTPDELYIFWDDKGWVSAKFYDLFDTDFKTKIKEYNDIESFNNATKEADLIIEKPDVCLKTLRGKSLGLKYDTIKKDIFVKYQKTFQYLKPKAEITEKINKNTPKNDFISLQIRNAPDWEDFGRNEDLNLFVSDINKTAKDETVYLSAMDNKTGNILRSKYKGQILELENKNYKSMQDAICDLYIMAKASKAIYSFGSTFGELAFWLRKDMQKVTIVGSQKKWINKKKLKKNK
ncbi:MAG: hypothetical protein K5622_03185 [Endomicrobiaceae bacterium]|nr:hypothetical protein [Endomicrobiaceae bacterium]